ncbi:MAG: tetratricopeptide repeat protein [Proteobacteria bacterium]|nr:tetratricopeptide repeat protein [Pseudomonadota bacterium]
MKRVAPLVNLGMRLAVFVLIGVLLATFSSLVPNSVPVWAQANPDGQASPASTPYRARPIPPAPPGFGVLPFENRSPYRSIAWLRAAVPFVLAEKVEHHIGLRPVYGPLVVPASPNANPAASPGENSAAQPSPEGPDEAESVAAFAAETGARWIFTGWVDRPNWKLEIGVTLWRIASGSAGAVRSGEGTPSSGAAVPVETFQARGDFAEVHTMVGTAIGQLAHSAGIAVAERAGDALARVPTEDFYAFTLMGRGLAALVGIGRAPNLVRAKRDLTRAVFIDPKLAEAQRVVGEMYLLLDKPELARARFDRAIELWPRYYPALAARAKLAREQGKLARARELYQNIIAARPWDLARRYEYGEVLWQDGDAGPSQAELDLVVARDPDHIGARRVLVLIYAARGKISDLADELEEVVRLAPDDVQSRLDLAAAYAAEGRISDAIRVYEALLGDHPDNLQAQKFLGDLYQKNGQMGKAVDAYRRMLDIAPSDPRPYFLLGGAYVRLGDDRAAKQVYRQAAMRLPRHLDRVYNNLGVIAYRQGRYVEAVRHLRRAVTKQPKSARLRYNFALALSAAGHPEMALQHIARGLKVQPDHAGLYYLRGVAKLRRGDRKAARAAFEKALALDPENHDALHNIRVLGRTEAGADRAE